MAATIAIAKGYDSNRVKEVHRLGSLMSEVQANTWLTFSKLVINKDGSGVFTLKRNGDEHNDSIYIEWNGEGSAIQAMCRANRDGKAVCDTQIMPDFKL